MAFEDRSTGHYPVVGQGNAQGRFRPDIDGSVYSWRLQGYIGNYNVAVIEYWIDPPPSTEEI